MEDAPEERSRKRRRSNDNEPQANQHNLPRTMTSTISPPPLRRGKNLELQKPETQDSEPKVLNSPFQLTWIQDLSELANLDAVTLKDILGDPMIAECWEFNYQHDLDFLMNAFDPDIRDIVQVNVVHGFWKNEDTQRINLKLAAEKYPNITLLTAFMPEMYGTHHTKMLVLIRHDDTAQIIIHTANMIPFDWTNMTQAVWKTPILPLLPPGTSDVTETGPVGSGSRFKVDFLNYLKAYDTKRVICKPLIDKLMKHDFSEVRGALIGSVPGKHGVESDSKTAWGWFGLKNTLNSVPASSMEPEVIIQISSIATVGPPEKWLHKTLFRSLSASKNIKGSKPKFKIIFPTADEIRRSLNGYNSGSAIHTKIQSPAQAKQMQALRPMLCHWAGDGEQHAGSSAPVLDAGRKRAAPHIKTYVRFSDSSQSSIDWMLVTSANLSKQAWGEAMNAGGDVRICSYELGVLVWPGLFGDKATMVPTFKTDTPTASGKPGTELVVGARMPYDLPLVPYGRDDKPWCATSSYAEPDWKGQVYRVERGG